MRWARKSPLCLRRKLYLVDLRAVFGPPFCKSAEPHGLGCALLYHDAAEHWLPPELVREITNSERVWVWRRFRFSRRGWLTSRGRWTARSMR